MVAVASRVPAKISSPAQNLFQMYFGGLESLGQTYDPFVKSIARGQIEFMGLLSRRAQAYVELPSRLSQCRMPQDFLNEQMQFWNTAMQQYSESASHISESLASFELPSFGFAPQANGARDVHDYITFPEPKEQVTTGRLRERKVA